jgi:hypothetical protein
LREGILSSERVDRIAEDPPVEVTFRRLISVADDFGRFTAHPSLVRAALYPLRLELYDDSDVTQHLERCESAGLIRLYAVGGKPLLEIADFRQRTRAKRSKYPPPGGYVDTEEYGWHSADTCPTHGDRSQPESEARDEIRETKTRRERRDIDSLATPARSNCILSTFTPKDTSQVKAAIKEYMDEEPDDDLVLSVLEAGGGASAEDICRHLNVLWLKGRKPGRRAGPGGFGWFIAVTRQHFNDIRRMEEARLNPTSAAHWSQTDAECQPDLEDGMGSF